MATFVEAMHGYVNLDKVAYIRQIKRQQGDYWEHALVFDGVNGEKLDQTYWLGRQPDIANLTAPVVAACPGHEAVVISVLDDEPVTKASLLVTHYPIIAWRIESDDLVRPILPEGVSGQDHLFIKLLDSSLCLPADRIVEHLDAAKEYVLEWELSHRAARHKPKDDPKKPTKAARDRE
jgi:hypothetical protein